VYAIIYTKMECESCGECHGEDKIRAGQTTHTTWLDNPNHQMEFWQELCNPSQTNIFIHSKRTLETQYGVPVDITYFAALEDGRSYPVIVGAIALVHRFPYFQNQDFTHYYAVSGTDSDTLGQIFGNIATLSAFHRLVYRYSFCWSHDIIY